MRVLIRNKLVSFGDGSEVLTEGKELLYKVKGKMFSPTKKKLIYNTKGELLYTIRNKYWTMFADRVFIFDANKNKVATIKKNKWSLNAKFEIEDCVDSMYIEGKMFSATAKIIKNEKEIDFIKKDFTIVKDWFVFEAEEKDIPFLSAIVIAFDNIKDKKQKD